jgi:hypothetical protein
MATTAQQAFKEFRINGSLPWKTDRDAGVKPGESRNPYFRVRAASGKPWQTLPNIYSGSESQNLKTVTRVRVER